MMRSFITMLLCSICAVAALPFSGDAEEDKTVLLAILARNKAHSLPKYLRCIDNLDYDKKLITVYINTNNNEDVTKELLESWAEKNEGLYKAIEFENIEISEMASTRPHEWTPERFKVLATIRNRSLDKAKEHDSDYYFVVDCDNFIVPETLKLLISKQKPIIAPMLRAVPESGDCYSNFFCAVDDYGYYRESPDYLKILTREIIGTFNVPVVHCTYLIDSKYLDKLSYLDSTDDYEFVIFSRQARKNGVDQWISNEIAFGELLHFYEDLTLEKEVERSREYLRRL